MQSEILLTISKYEEFVQILKYPYQYSSIWVGNWPIVERPQDPNTIYLFFFFGFKVASLGGTDDYMTRLV